MFILVLILNLYNPQPAVSMQEFKTRKACIQAGVYIKKSVPSASFLCVEK